MNWLEFFAELFCILSWPVAGVIIYSVTRRELDRLDKE